MGKTSFALNIIEHAAIVQQKPIALFSLEMSSTQIMQRLLYSMALTSSKDAKNKSKSINEASTILKNSKIFIDDKTNITINDINLKCKKLKREQGIEMVVIDYLQLMGGGNSQSREREISEISRGLKCLAKELQIPVIALSQLNRSLESRFDKRPIMSDLRESGAIEQDADLIIFLYRDEVYNKSSLDRSLAEVIVSKHRSGPIGTIKLGFVDQYTKFFDLA
jgi:replicative DNA helicase